MNNYLIKQTVKYLKNKKTMKRKIINFLEDVLVWFFYLCAGMGAALVILLTSAVVDYLLSFIF